MHHIFHRRLTAGAATLGVIVALAGGHALAIAVPAAAAEVSPIAIDGISGGTVTPDGDTGYTLTIPGLTPSASYRASVGNDVGSWTYQVEATTNGSGLGTFAITFPAPPSSGMTIRVLAEPTSLDFPGTDVTFGATTDTTPVAIAGLAGATIAGDGGTGYLLAVPGLTPNAGYEVYDTGSMSSFAHAVATADGAGRVTFAFPSVQWAAEPGATLNLASMSFPAGIYANGVFMAPGASPEAPGVVIAPADDTANVVAIFADSCHPDTASSPPITIDVAANDVATRDGVPIAASDLTYTLIATPGAGTITWNADHSLVYLGRGGSENSPVGFTYRVTDTASGVYADADVTVTVTGARSSLREALACGPGGSRWDPPPTPAPTPSPTPTPTPSPTPVVTPPPAVPAVRVPRVPTGAAAGEADTSGQLIAGGAAGLAALLAFGAAFARRRRHGDA